MRRLPRHLPAGDARLTPDLPAAAATFVDLALAVGLGLLVGLQREWADTRVAGIRTFPLITLFGTLSGILALAFGGWAVVAGLVVLGAVVVMGDVALLRVAEARGREPDPGLTTEAAALMMFAVGVLLPLGYRAPAIVLGGTVAVLLHWKRPLHDLVDRIGADDVQAIMRFALLALVILPVLPNRSFGPYEVLNPFEIWLMVVLIVGISLGAYVASRLLGGRGGALAAGVLGGFISSTATSVSYARRSREGEGRSAAAAVVIMIASAVVFLRVLGEVTVVAPEILGVVAPPLAAMMAYLVVLSAGAYVVERRRLATGPQEDRSPPSELGAAIAFGVLYALVLLGVAVAKEHFGQEGLYLVAALSGLTDMDAITLSTAQLARAGQVADATAWRLILVGALANVVFKGMVVVALGARALTRRVAVLFGLTLAGGAVLLLFWP